MDRKVFRNCMYPMETVSHGLTYNHESFYQAKVLLAVELH